MSHTTTTGAPQTGNGTGAPRVANRVKEVIVEHAPVVAGAGSEKPAPAPVEKKKRVSRALANCSAIGATMLSSAVIFLCAAAVIAVTLYVVLRDQNADAPSTWWDAWSYLLAPIAGAVAGMLACLCYALITNHNAHPGRLDPHGNSQLCDRREALKTQIRLLCPATAAGDRTLIRELACAEAIAHQDALEGELRMAGAHWVMGSGLVDAWRHLNAAEQALLAVKPPEVVVGEALLDELRLEGCVIKQRADLLAKLRAAVRVLGAPHYVAPGPAVPVFGSPPDSQTPDDAATQARVVLQDVRRVINSFRDDKWDGLVRARNRLVWTGTVTAVSAYVLLGLAMLVKSPPSMIVAAAAFYLVGTAVGLFNQLRNDARSQVGQEDFGFARARLFYTPVLSGLAGVGGVLVIAMLYGTATEGLDVMYALEGSAVTDPPVPSLSTIFDLSRNRFGLVVAAVFGLTPDLLIDRLQRVADRYRDDMVSTAAYNGETTGGTG